MKEYLISLFIDNELDIEEKITFVETVHDDRRFTDEAISLLRQEKRLRAELTVPVMVAAMPPVPEIAAPKSNFLSFWGRRRKRRFKHGKEILILKKQPVICSTF